MRRALPAVPVVVAAGAVGVVGTLPADVAVVGRPRRGGRLPRLLRSGPGPHHPAMAPARPTGLGAQASLPNHTSDPATLSSSVTRARPTHRSVISDGTVSNPIEEPMSA